jgi:hypothetical protein
MFIAACAALVARRIINAIREADRDDKAMKANNALPVRTNHRDDY